MGRKPRVDRSPEVSQWAISTIRGGIWLVLLACFVGMLVVFISKSTCCFG
jgi:hypothetical protein